MLQHLVPWIAHSTRNGLHWRRAAYTIGWYSTCRTGGPNFDSWYASWQAASEEFARLLVQTLEDEKARQQLVASDHLLPTRLEQTLQEAQASISGHARHSTRTVLRIDLHVPGEAFVSHKLEDLRRVDSRTMQNEDGRRKRRGPSGRQAPPLPELSGTQRLLASELMRLAIRASKVEGAELEGDGAQAWEQVLAQAAATNSDAIFSDETRRIMQTLGLVAPPPRRQQPAIDYASNRRSVSLTSADFSPSRPPRRQNGLASDDRTWAEFSTAGFSESKAKPDLSLAMDTDELGLLRSPTRTETDTKLGRRMTMRRVTKPNQTIARRPIVPRVTSARVVELVDLFQDVYFDTMLLPSFPSFFIGELDSSIQATGAPSHILITLTDQEPSELALPTERPPPPRSPSPPPAAPKGAASSKERLPAQEPVQAPSAQPVAPKRDSAKPSMPAQAPPQRPTLEKAVKRKTSRRFSFARFFRRTKSSPPSAPPLPPAKAPAALSTGAPPPPSLPAAATSRPAAEAPVDPTPSVRSRKSSTATGSVVMGKTSSQHSIRRVPPPCIDGPPVEISGDAGGKRNSRASRTSIEDAPMEEIAEPQEAPAPPEKPADAPKPAFETVSEAPVHGRAIDGPETVPASITGALPRHSQLHRSSECLSAELPSPESETREDMERTPVEPSREVLEPVQDAEPSSPASGAQQHDEHQDTRAESPALQTAPAQEPCTEETNAPLAIDITAAPPEVARDASPVRNPVDASAESAHEATPRRATQPAPEYGSPLTPSPKGTDTSRRLKELLRRANGGQNKSEPEAPPAPGTPRFVENVRKRVEEIEGMNNYAASRGSIDSTSGGGNRASIYFRGGEAGSREGSVSAAGSPSREFVSSASDVSKSHAHAGSVSSSIGDSSATSSAAGGHGGVAMSDTATGTDAQSFATAQTDEDAQESVRDNHDGEHS